MAGDCSESYVRKTCCATCAKSVCEDNNTAIIELARAHDVEGVSGCSEVSADCDDPFVRHHCCATCGAGSGSDLANSSSEQASEDTSAESESERATFTTTAHPHDHRRPADRDATNLANEHFDINKRGEHMLLRVPLDPELKPSFVLEIVTSTKSNESCRPGISDVTLRGGWLGTKIVSVRPRKDNSAGTGMLWPFSARVFNETDLVGAWRAVENVSEQEALTDTVTMSATAVKDGVGEEAFVFLVGEGSQATVRVAQTPRGLNVTVRDLAALGERKIGGILGTEGHGEDLEETSSACKAERDNKSIELLLEDFKARRIKVSASWH